MAHLRRRSSIMKSSGFTPSDILDIILEANGAGNFVLSGPGTDEVETWIDQKADNDFVAATVEPIYDLINSVKFNRLTGAKLQLNDITDFKDDLQGEFIVVSDNFNGTRDATAVTWGGNILNQYLKISYNSSEIPFITFVNGATQNLIGSDQSFFDILGTAGDNKKIMTTFSSNASRYQITMNNQIQVTTLFSGVNDGKWIGDSLNDMLISMLGVFINPGLIGDWFNDKMFFVGYSSTELTVQQRTNLFNYLDSIYTIPGSA